MARESDDKKKKKKKDQSALEAEMFAFMQKCLDAALRAALNDVFKDFH